MTQIQQRNGLQGRSVFVSASIPDPTRWPADFRALDITDAVVAVARAVLQRGGRLVTAAHPTIAPLLLYVASETQRSSRPSVVVYQSAVFEPVLPESTRRFEADGVGELIRTPAVGDEPPDPVRATKSLPLMRRQMLTSEAPIGAVFVGGWRASLPSTRCSMSCGQRPRLTRLAGPAAPRDRWLICLPRTCVQGSRRATSTRPWLVG